MYKLLDILFNFSDKRKIDFNKGIALGVLVFLFALLLCKLIIR
jgi:hypothetical protein